MLSRVPITAKSGPRVSPAPPRSQIFQEIIGAGEKMAALLERRRSPGRRAKEPIPQIIG